MDLSTNSRTTWLGKTQISRKRWTFSADHSIPAPTSHKTVIFGCWSLQDSTGVEVSKSLIPSNNLKGSCFNTCLWWIERAKKTNLQAKVRLSFMIKLFKRLMQKKLRRAKSWDVGMVLRASWLLLQSCLKQKLSARSSNLTPVPLSSKNTYKNPFW